MLYLYTVLIVIRRRPTNFQVDYVISTSQKFVFT